MIASRGIIIHVDLDHFNRGCGVGWGGAARGNHEPLKVTFHNNNNVSADHSTICLYLSTLPAAG